MPIRYGRVKWMKCDHCGNMIHTVPSNDSSPDLCDRCWHEYEVEQEAEQDRLEGESEARVTDTGLITKGGANA